MALVNLRDPRHVAEALLPWLREKMPQAEAIELPPPRLPEIGGSSDTFFITPVVRARGVERLHEWVLRVEPTGYRVYKDHAVEPQFKIMETLARSGEVPVPEVFWYEDQAAFLGAPFFLMARVAGEALPTLYHSQGLWARSGPASREAMWRSSVENLARVHRVDPAPFGFLARAPARSGLLKAELDYWDDYGRWSEIALRPEHRRGHRWLADNMPADPRTTLAWGDARPGNMIFRNDACQAVIDWETASLGCAEFDLGWWLFFDWYVSDGIGVPRLDGVGDRAATLRLWEGLVGRTAEAMDWHEIFATWRFGLIVDRALLLTARLGQLDREAEMGGDVVALRLATLLDEQAAATSRQKGEVG